MYFGRPFSSWSLTSIIFQSLSLPSLAADPTDVSTIAQDPETLWGPFRSNLYFGIKPRIPKSLSFGLMWTAVQNEQPRNETLRHTCEQSDNMDVYGWTSYNVRRGGVNRILDSGNAVNLTAEFIKSQDGGSWGVRIKGHQIGRHDSNWGISTVFYFSLEDTASPLSSLIECENIGSLVDSQNSTVCQGKANVLGSFRITMPPARSDKHFTNKVITSLQDDDHLWQTKKIFLGQKVDKTKIVKRRPTDGKIKSGNLVFVQNIFTDDFEFDVLLASTLAKSQISSDDITEGMPAVTSSFEEQFDSAYRPSPQFGNINYTRFGQAMLSNLLGGLGYFYGTAVVDESHNPAYEEEDPDFWRTNPEIRDHAEKNVTEPYELFTCVPSRPFFPRGFLWDEGFHQLVLIEWDIDLSMEVVRSWLSLMDSDGWIAREQILGDEARSKVPEQYWTQYPEFANPPMLFLVVQRFMAKSAGREEYHGAPSRFLGNADMTNRLLRNIYPLLKRNYFWFRRTQAGNVEGEVEGYRWKGHTIDQILTSGLDDYPRAIPPHPSELHVDAISWIGLMADILADIGGHLNVDQDRALFQRHHAAIQHSIDSIHWSEAEQNYCDTTSINGTREHECHNGYTSLLPFVTGLLSPTHPHLEKVLDFIHSNSTIWSPYGLRSLSKSDPFYLTGENYWRAPVWVNFNYLVIAQLLEYAVAQGPLQQRARAMYKALRENVIRTVYESWKETGYAWEQYNQDSGKGQRTQHFNGWTTLVVKILHMPDLDSAAPSSVSASTSHSHRPPLYNDAARMSALQEDSYDSFGGLENFKVQSRADVAVLSVSPIQWMMGIVVVMFGLRYRWRIVRLFTMS